MDELATCQVEQRGRATWLTLHRPEAMNAVDEAMLSDLAAAVARVRDDRSTRALVVTGAGDAFCVGLDLSLLERAFADLDYFDSVVRRFNAILHDLEELDLPVVAAVNGLARAGGFELLLACDLVVIAGEARIADHHASFGMIPGGGATQRLPRKIGDQRARALLFTARWLDGPEAVEWGLALESAPRADLIGRVEALLAELVDKPRVGHGAVKQAIAAGQALDLRAAVNVELDAFARYLREHDAGHEGFAAYTERRVPSWR